MILVSDMGYKPASEIKSLNDETDNEPHVGSFS
jgi:hypothetical protein